MSNAKPYAVSPGWKVLLHDAGLSPADVLRRAALPGDLFGRDKAALTTAEYFRLWHGIETEADDPNLPLRIGAAISVEAFDPPIFAALCSPDLDTALGRIAHYKKLIAAMALHVDVGDDATTLELEWLDKTVAPPAVLVLTELVFFVQLARMGTRAQVCPVAVTSPHLPDSREDFTAYFGVPVGYGPSPRLVFAAHDAKRSFLTANEKMWEVFEPELKRRLADLTEAAGTAERVQSALLELLPSGDAAVETVATKLGTSPRTLQRRLKKESQSFQTILDRTREALANHYLKTSAMTGAEISFLLGFEDPNSFFRAFNVWTGRTPEQARRALSAIHR
jgi:AraC-like DNA-binding protein